MKVGKEREDGMHVAAEWGGKEGRRAEEGRKEYNQSDKGNVKERRQEGGKKEGYHIRN